MATSDEELQRKRAKAEELREAISKAKAERERHARESQNDIEANALDEEIARLERVLAAERALTDHQAGSEATPVEQPAAPAKGTATDKKKEN